MSRCVHSLPAILREAAAVCIRSLSWGSFDADFVLWLARTVIFHDPVPDCLIKGSPREWDGLPHAKSLFYARAGAGLPIGNLTSQLFANIYLNDFDQFVKRELGCAYYGRYVDDIVIVDEDRVHLRALVPALRAYLSEHLALTLHPRKVYLQHFTKGVVFLGTVIKPFRRYVGKRMKGAWHRKIRYWNNVIEQGGDRAAFKEARAFIACMNAYHGMCTRTQSASLRAALNRRIHPTWCRYVHVDPRTGMILPRLVGETYE